MFTFPDFIKKLWFLRWSMESTAYLKSLWSISSPAQYNMTCGLYRIHDTDVYQRGLECKLSSKFFQQIQKQYM
jgi:hypothetical protein